MYERIGVWMMRTTISATTAESLNAQNSFCASVGLNLPAEVLTYRQDHAGDAIPLVPGTKRFCVALSKRFCVALSQHGNRSGEIAMPTPKEYRLRAIECLELMKEPNEWYVRAELAAEFRKRAEGIEGTQRTTQPPLAKAS
jgi:hypothetical protein